MHTIRSVPVSLLSDIGAQIGESAVRRSYRHTSFCRRAQALGLARDLRRVTLRGLPSPCHLTNLTHSANTRRRLLNFGIRWTFLGGVCRRLGSFVVAFSRVHRDGIPIDMTHKGLGQPFRDQRSLFDYLSWIIVLFLRKVVHFHGHQSLTPWHIQSVCSQIVEKWMC